MKRRSSEWAGVWIPRIVIWDPDQPANLERGRPGVAELYPLPMSYRRLGSVIPFPLHSLRAFAENPLTHIGRALNQFNALIFAANQEPNHHEVHQSDFAQVQNLTFAAIPNCRLNGGDM